jgi:hypothetical protein
MHGKEVLLGDVDHDLYAARIFGRLWKLYVDDPENGLSSSIKTDLKPTDLHLF